ncbi:MAG: hypothetical protein ABSD62_06495 [Candidatus Limnocylindrales bacterium]|jgi:hypothetical protein
MRKLTLALAVGLLLAGTVTVANSHKVVAAASPTCVGTKVVLVVGQTQGVTHTYIDDANNAATEFLKYTSLECVTKVYSPNATWGLVQAAAKGANILVYMGHGSGYPNPYVGYEQPNKDSGMGLNRVAGESSNAASTYYGANYMAQLQLAPNALVILNHLCYASGNSEGGYPNPTLATAKTRVDGYAAGFLRGGAKAVIAEGTYDISYYIDTVFTGHTTVDWMWKHAPSFNGHVIGYTSTRPSAEYTSQLDPEVANPAAGGSEVYYRSMVSIPSTTTDSIISSHRATFVGKSGSYYPIAPTRLVDSRYFAIGPKGSLTAGGGYNFQIAGRQMGSNTPVPSDAIAITANVTVTGATGAGWVYLGPTIDTPPTTSTINFPKGDDRANGVTVGLSPEGTVGAWYGAGSGNTVHLIIDVTGFFRPGTGGAGYVAFGPKRVLDTRPNSGISNLTGRFSVGQHRVIKIAGQQGLPASGIKAVTGNLTVVAPSAFGLVFLGPDPTDAPASSTINFPKGDNRANNVIVPVNADGTLSAVLTSPTGSATVDLVLDITGYFTASGGALLNTMQPDRIMDSRTPTGVPGRFSADIAQTLLVTGGVVPNGAVAITGNLTVTQQTSGGFAAVGPTIDASTNFSNLNFPVRDDRANGVTVPLSYARGDGSGRLDVIFVTVAPGPKAHLLLDVTGYYMGSA